MDLDEQPTHEEIWDDSALVESWNQALDEYKKYHSIHAQGGAVEDILRAERDRNAKPETEARGEPIESAAPPPQRKSDETPKGIDSKSSQDAKKANGPNSQSQTSPAAGVRVMAPQTVLGSVQDEDLKKLLMSWYYAGYYTGLYEGKQQMSKSSQ